MQEFTYDERKCLPCRFEYLKSNRFILFNYVVFSTRTIYVNYQQLFSDKRYVCLVTNPFISERKLFKPSISEKYTSNRLCISGYGESTGDFRYIYYIPGDSELIWTVQIQLPIRYKCNRYLLACNGGFSQRLITFPYIIFSDRHMVLRRIAQVRVDSPEVLLTICHYGERKITYCIGNISSRLISCKYIAISERIIKYATTNEGVIYSPPVYIGVKNLYSTRYILTGGDPTWTERLVLMLVNLYSERSIGLHYRAPSERYVATSVFRMKRMHTPKIIPASIRNTARFILFNAISNDSERYIFLETRELYISKSPILSSPSVSIRKDEDSFSSYKLVNDRNMEYYGVSDVDNIQRQDAVNTTKLIIQGRDNIDLTAVDNKGSMITLSGVNMKKILKFSFKSILNLIK